MRRAAGGACNGRWPPLLLTLLLLSSCPNCPGGDNERRCRGLCAAASDALRLRRIRCHQRLRGCRGSSSRGAAAAASSGTAAACDGGRDREALRRWRKDQRRRRRGGGGWPSALPPLLPGAPACARGGEGEKCDCRPRVDEAAREAPAVALALVLVLLAAEPGELALDSRLPDDDIVGGAGEGGGGKERNKDKEKRRMGWKEGARADETNRGPAATRARGGGKSSSALKEGAHRKRKRAMNREKERERERGEKDFHPLFADYKRTRALERAEGNWKTPANSDEGERKKEDGDVRREMRKSERDDDTKDEKQTNVLKVSL